MPKNKSLVSVMPNICIPVPIAMFCYKKCCDTGNFPLWVCKAVPGHKSQGVSIDIEELFERVVLHYLETESRAPPDLQIVMMSSPDGLESFCVGNKVSHLNKGGLKKIGNSTFDSKQLVYQVELKEYIPPNKGPNKGIDRSAWSTW